MSFINQFLGIILKNRTGRDAMKKGLIALMFVAAAALLMNGCAAKSEMAAQGNIEGKTVTISTGDFFEACDMQKKWTPGSKVNFKFASSAPVTFNVHYHQGHEKMYAIEQTTKDNFDGSFIVKGEGIHCGMWKNDNPNYVTLTYDISVEKQ